MYAPKLCANVVKVERELGRGGEGLWNVERGTWNVESGEWGVESGDAGYGVREGGHYEMARNQSTAVGKIVN